MKIVICDRGYSSLLNIEHVTERLCRINAVSAQISVFHEYETCRKALLSDCVDILILEASEEGMVLAEWIYNFDKQCRLIFVASNEEYVADSRKVKACDYLIKPITEKSLLRALQETSRLFCPEYCFTFVQEYHTRRVLYSDIVYIESKGRQVNMYLRDGTSRTFYEQMKELEPLLWPHQIIRCHRKYFVNLAAIEGMERSEIQLIHGVTVPTNRIKYKMIYSMCYDEGLLLKEVN